MVDAQNACPLSADTSRVFTATRTTKKGQQWLSRLRHVICNPPPRPSDIQTPQRHAWRPTWLPLDEAACTRSSHVRCNCQGAEAGEQRTNGSEAEQRLACARFKLADGQGRHLAGLRATDRPSCGVPAGSTGRGAECRGQAWGGDQRKGNREQRNGGREQRG